MRFPELGLDHVGLAVFGLDAARAAFERLGFTLTPRSMHAGSAGSGRPVEPWGSGNHCAMFRRGYFELLGLVDPALPSNVKKMLEHHEGLHIVAMRCKSADEAHRALRAGGVASAAPMALERDATFGPRNDTTRRAKFRNINLDQASYPEARFIVIEHLTPEVLWQDHLLDHENGAQALCEVFFVADDIAATQARYTRLFGAATAVGAALRFDLAGGCFWVMTEQAMRSHLPRALSELPLHHVTAAGIAVSSLAALETLFDARGIRHARGRTLDGAAPAVWVGTGDASHSILQFTQAV